MDAKRLVKIRGKDKLLADWLAILRRYANEDLGLKVPDDIGGDIAVWLATRMSRIPKIRPRKVETVKGFVIPKENKRGWINLSRKIEKGHDLLPHLSRQINKIKAVDAMHTFWGINHFHLGMIPDPKHKGLVKGGSNIVYANLVGNSFLAVAIAPHDHFKDIEIIEKLAKQWPTHPNISRNMLITSPGTNEENWMLRDKQVNVSTVLSDGSLWMGGFMTCSGSSGQGQAPAMHWTRVIRGIERDIETNFAHYFPLADQLEEDEVDAELVVHDDGRLAVFVPEINSKSIFNDIGTLAEIVDGWRGNQG